MAEKETGVDKEVSEEEKKGNKDENKEQESALRSYLDIGTLVVPIIKRDRVEAYVRISLQIATKNSTAIDPFRPYKKRLRDAYFTDLYQVLCDQWLPGKEPSRDTLQKRLTRVTDKVVSSDSLITYVTSFYFYKPDK